MTSEPFLTIDEQPITIGQIFRYLQASRKLDGFIGDIVRQFVIERELQAQSQQAMSSVAIEQAVIDFRLQNQLTDPNQFQQWLNEHGLTYEAFHTQLATNFRLKKLKDDITEPKLQEYFIGRKVFLDRVVLSRIIVADKELAEELKSQLQEGSSFEQLAKDYSLTDDRLMNGMVGPVSRGTMPDILRAAIDLAQPGEVVGPIGMEERWGLFRVEALLPATLDDPQLHQSLQDELFEQWLGEKMQTLPIKIQVNA
ncbi:peptidylprolyl isomerase [Leptolyngbya sp. FACHB-711]|uniref:peptidylprolyl isomerase n=1 Tax=unclassified Leptolyngbya TaxID=2650499 RepID=UPI001689EF22|nr:peptidylprolyl isomerase [Leptolyngbya sp. FACHB-711]MBD1851831.1 peptidylprolyl isomerase [Cyanobacteria bacterium FACHB-502]MBD2026717.1 peptidylprolyl isomerase [Leptolyngbya sp. FACHB-711]